MMILMKNLLFNTKFKHVRGSELCSQLVIIIVEKEVIWLGDILIVDDFNGILYP